MEVSCSLNYGSLIEKVPLGECPQEGGQKSLQEGNPRRMDDLGQGPMDRHCRMC